MVIQPTHSLSIACNCCRYYLLPGNNNILSSSGHDAATPYTPFLPQSTRHRAAQHAPDVRGWSAFLLLLFPEIIVFPRQFNRAEWVRMPASNRADGPFRRLERRGGAQALRHIPAPWGPSGCSDLDRHITYSARESVPRASARRPSRCKRVQVSA